MSCANKCDECGTYADVGAGQWLSISLDIPAGASGLFLGPTRAENFHACFECAAALKDKSKLFARIFAFRYGAPTFQGNPQRVDIGP